MLMFCQYLVTIELKFLCHVLNPVFGKKRKKKKSKYNACKIKTEREQQENSIPFSDFWITEHTINKFNGAYGTIS